MKKQFFLKSLTIEINLNKITSIIGNNKEVVVRDLKAQYCFPIVDIIFNKAEKLVSKMVSNSKKEIEIIKVLGLQKLLDKNYNSLGIEDKCLVSLAVFLPTVKDIVLFNDLLSYLKEKQKVKVLNYLRKQKVTVLNFTSNIEEALLGDDIVVLDNEVVLAGDKLSVLKNEKSLKNLGLSLPFIIDISIQLNLYGLIKKIYVDSNKLLGDLWK